MLLTRELSVRKGRVHQSMRVEHEEYCNSATLVYGSVMLASLESPDTPKELLRRVRMVRQMNRALHGRGRGGGGCIVQPKTI